MKEVNLYNCSFKICGNDLSLRYFATHATTNSRINRSGSSFTVNNIDKYHDLLHSVRPTTYDLDFKLDCMRNEILDIFVNPSKFERMNYEQSVLRARKKLFDLIKCNHGKWLDFNGQKAHTKFLTLTFRSEITDIKAANKQFTEFNKRLSYSLFNVHKNVLKYICIPEIQPKRQEKTGLSVWHFHIIYFNLPYIKQSLLLKIWGAGGVNVQSLSKDIKGKSIRNTSAYVAKYIGKCVVGGSAFDLYKKSALKNMKRYNTSRSLLQPYVGKIYLNDSDLDVYEDSCEGKHQYCTTKYNKYIGHIVYVRRYLNNNEIKHFINRMYSIQRSSSWLNGTIKPCLLPIKRLCKIANDKVDYFNSFDFDAFNAFDCIPTNVEAIESMDKPTDLDNYIQYQLTFDDFITNL